MTTVLSLFRAQPHGIREGQPWWEQLLPGVSNCCQRRFLMSGGSSWEAGAAGDRSAHSAVQGPSRLGYMAVKLCGDRG